MLRLVIGQGMALAVVGIAIGVVGGLLLTRLLTSQLYSIKATDPMTFVGVAALLAAIAFVATLVPALRATRVDPVVALREECKMVDALLEHRRTTPRPKRKAS